jgi:hypothetical protein
MPLFLSTAAGSFAMLVDDVAGFISIAANCDSSAATRRSAALRISNTTSSSGMSIVSSIAAFGNN